MPYILIATGLMFAYLAYEGKGSLNAAGSLLEQELFTNQDPFYKWLGALIIVGLLGYIPETRPIAVAMLTLIILSIVLTKRDPNRFKAVTALEKAL